MKVKMKWKGTEWSEDLKWNEAGMSEAAWRTEKATGKEEWETAKNMTALPLATYGDKALVYALKVKNILNKCWNGLAWLFDDDWWQTPLYIDF